MIEVIVWCLVCTVLGCYFAYKAHPEDPELRARCEATLKRCEMTDALIERMEARAPKPGASIEEHEEYFKELEACRIEAELIWPALRGDE